MPKTLDNVLEEFRHGIRVYVADKSRLLEAPICIDLGDDKIGLTRWMSRETAEYLRDRLDQALALVSEGDPMLVGQE